MTGAAVLHTGGLSAKSSEPNHGEGGYAARPRPQNQSVHPNLKLSEELQSPHFSFFVEMGVSIAGAGPLIVKLSE